jgi:hypothetical protein
MYAGDFQDYYPPWSDPGNPGHPFNVLKGEHYTRYVIGPTASASNVRVPQGNYTQPGFEYQNLGFLFAGKYIGDGHVLFCPSYPSKSPLSADEYSVPSFMSTCGPLSPDPSQNPGLVRSSYLYNPRVTNPTNADDISLARAYQKSTTAPGHKLFTMDYMEVTTGVGMPFNANSFPHFPSKGWMVLFTDGAAKYITSPTVFTIATTQLLPAAETTATRTQYNTIFDDLELAEK